MSDLKGKNIIITGASGGIGNSIVKNLYDQGANILASGTRLEKLEELKKKFEKIKISKFDISQSDKIDEKFKEVIISKIPSARLGEADDVANAVLFLSSNQSSYINGETLHVNGGMYMAWQNRYLNY